MSKIQPKRAYGKEIFEKFGGFETVNDRNRELFHRLINLRINALGDLEKRNGWEPYYTFPGTIRGAWGITLGNAWVGVVIVGCDCYLIGHQVGESEMYEMIQMESELLDNTNPISFQVFGNHLILMDGEEIYALTDDGVKQANGYVPLYGLQWDPIDFGEVLEPLNLFSNKIRINYRNPDGLHTFVLPFYAVKFDYILVDGKETKDFQYYNNSKSIVLDNTGLEVDVIYTFSPENNFRTGFRTCRAGFAAELNDEPYLLLAGFHFQLSLFKGYAVPEAQHNGARRFFPDCMPLYFTVQNCKQWDGVNDAYAFYQHNDTVFMFLQNGVCAILPSKNDEGLKLLELPNTPTCLAKNMNAYIEGTPLILNKNGLFRLRFSGDFEISYTQIPCPYPELTAPAFSDRAIIFQNHLRNEIWFRDPLDEDGTVMIYNTMQKVWYRFKGIHAERFFDVLGRIGIVCGNTVGVFSDGLYADNGVPIEAVWESDLLDFGAPEVPKRALRLSLTADTGGAPVEVSLNTGTRERTLSFTGSDGELPDHFDARAAMGRFRHLRVRIRHSAPKRFRPKRMALFANL